MRVHVVKNSKSGEFEVWVSLPDTLTRELRTATESFLIASGPDARSALRSGSKTLTDCIIQIAVAPLDGIPTI